MIRRALILALLTAGCGPGSIAALVSLVQGSDLDVFVLQDPVVLFQQAPPAGANSSTAAFTVRTDGLYTFPDNVTPEPVLEGCLTRDEAPCREEDFFDLEAGASPPNLPGVAAAFTGLPCVTIVEEDEGVRIGGTCGLTLTGLENQSNYSFTVRLTIRFRRGNRLAQVRDAKTHIWRVNVGPQPGVPRELRVTEATATTVSLAWREPEPGGEPVAGFRVFYGTDASSPAPLGEGAIVFGLRRDAPVDVGLIGEVTLSNLPRCRRHYFAVAAVSEAGTESTPTDVVSVRTACGADGTFGDPIAAAGGADYVAVAAGDFDRDGRDDLALADHGAGRVVVRLSDGGGGFVSAPHVEGLAGVSQLVCADLDANGRPDLVAGLDGEFAVLLGRGDGTFAAPVRYPAPRLHTLAVGKFTTDTIPDVLAMCTEELRLFPGAPVAPEIGRGSGGLDAPLVTPGLPAAHAGAAADVDGDALLDVVLGRSGTARLLVVPGDGGGTLEETLPDVAGAIATADFDRDGTIDIAAANRDPLGQVTVITAGGGFTHAAGTGPRALVVGDFDTNGVPDLAVANELSHDVTVLLGRGDGTFDAAPTRAVGADPVAIATGDFDGDGIADLATANGGTASVFLGHGAFGAGDGTFDVALPSLATVDAPAAIEAADLNGDGYADLAVLLNPADLSARPPTVAVYLGTGRPARDAPSFAPPIVYSAGSANGLAAVSLLLADLDGDLAVDIVVGRRPADVLVLPNTGGGAFGPAVAVPGVTVEPSDLAVEDFDRDGIPDLMVVSGPESWLEPHLGTGGFGFVAAERSPQPGIDCRTAETRRAVLHDFDADGLIDYASVSSLPDEIAEPIRCQRIHVFRGRGLLGIGDGRFTFGSPAYIEVAVEMTDLAEADLDGDGIQDLVFTDLNNWRVHGYRGGGSGGIGDGTFARAGEPTRVGQRPLALSLGDFDGDGRPDAATANEDGTVSVLPGRGDGTFRADTGPYPVGDAPVALAVGDFTGDGVPDLAVACRGPSPGVWILEAVDTAE